MPAFIDQIGRIINLPKRPERIVSLVPSQTELLAHLGLEEEVVGITKFCIHPNEWYRSKTRIGGTKNINLQKIRAINPDLIIANKEENVREQIEELAKEFPVWVSDVNTLEEAYSMIKAIGTITGKEEKAVTLAKEIESQFCQLLTNNYQSPTCCYLIWKDPFMTVGGDTFINEMLAQAGFNNIYKNKKRYPPLTTGQLQTANCQLLLLSSEPYPFQQKHIDDLQTHLPQTKIILVDGEMFSWYGSRLLYAPAYFRALQTQVAAML